jgi:hypothetical protein
MQALKQENKVVFYKKVGGVSTKIETTNDEMDFLIDQEILAREFVSKVKEMFEKWASETYICSKNKIYVGGRPDESLYYCTSDCSIARPIDRHYNVGILNTAYNLAREYGLCVTCVHRGGNAIYEFWIDSK